MKKRNTIMVVDMIHGFITEGALHDERIMEIVPNIQELIRSFANNKETDYVIFEDAHSENSVEFKSFPPHCLKGTKESKTIPTIAQEMNGVLGYSQIVDKNSTNGFYRYLEDFDKTPVESHREYVIVGCCSDICVLHLALSLKTYLNEEDFDSKVIVLEDCISTFDAPNHNAEEVSNMALTMMKIAGIEVMKLEDYINE